MKQIHSTLKTLLQNLFNVRFRAQENHQQSKNCDTTILVCHINFARIPSAWCYDSPDPNASQKIRAQFTGKFLVGHAAAMDHSDKGHHVLLQAARILQSDYPDIHFYGSTTMFCAYMKPKKCLVLSDAQSSF